MGQSAARTVHRSGIAGRGAHTLAVGQRQHILPLRSERQTAEPIRQHARDGRCGGVHINSETDIST